MTPHFEAKSVLRSHEPYANIPTLARYIAHFDSNWQKEGLPEDWYKLSGIGFSMKSAMNLFGENTQENKQLWLDQNRMDMLGFALEYLSGGLVYTFKYYVEQKPDGQKALYDHVYKKFMTETVSAQERGGSVLEAIKKEEAFLLDETTPDGAMTVRFSPKGPSGLQTDTGEYIDYPDSYIFISQKQGDQVLGATIKTDFSIAECNEAMYQLTGTRLPFGATLQDYNRVLATITPSERRTDLKTPQDIVGILAKVREENSKKHNNTETGDKAFKNQSWDEVYRDLGRREELYTFSKEVQEAMTDFSTYVSEIDVSHLSLEDAKRVLQKSAAATLLRLSKYFIEEKQIAQLPDYERFNRKRYADKPNAVAPQQLGGGMSFGSVFTEVKKIEGCAGGGSSTENSSTSVFSSINRNGKKTNDAEDKSSWFTCPHCDSSFKPPVGDECPGCHYTKADFIKEHPELAC